MDNFETLLKEATRRVASDYFQLPIAGKDGAVYRERVYCYELYHQLRLNWPVDSEYRLSGEVDKNGHPLIWGGNLDNVKPDFLVHVPGRMWNAVAMEVKAVTLDAIGLRKDLRTLTAFTRDPANYKRAILLVYGGDALRRVRQLASALVVQRVKGIDPTAVELWVHSMPGEEAVAAGTIRNVLIE
jgi:hypothetical protein